MSIVTVLLRGGWGSQDRKEVQKTEHNPKKTRPKKKAPLEGAIKEKRWCLSKGRSGCCFNRDAIWGRLSLWG